MQIIKTDADTNRLLDSIRIKPGDPEAVIAPLGERDTAEARQPGTSYHLKIPDDLHKFSQTMEQLRAIIVC